MIPSVTAFVFAFGAAAGSFVNALLYRLHTGESIAHGRSHCPACMHVLGVADLVPVVSWLALGGRCRYCRKPYGVGYLVIELTLGALFVLAAWDFVTGRTLSLDPNALAQLLLRWYGLAVLLVIFTYDLRHMLILRAVTLPATLLLFAGNLLLGRGWADLALGMALGAGVFWLQYALSRGKWIGGGDIHLGALMGALLGWKLCLAAVFLAYMVGALYGVVVLALRRKTWKSEVPFGTFLSAAAAVMLLWGEPVVAWYLALIS